MTLGLLEGGELGVLGTGFLDATRSPWALQGTLMGPQAYLAGWEAPGEPRFHPLALVGPRALLGASRALPQGSPGSESSHSLAA